MAVHAQKRIALVLTGSTGIRDITPWEHRLSRTKLDIISRFDNNKEVIVNFACRKTQRLWERRRDHDLPPQIERVALRKLTQIHRSRHVRDLQIPPGNRLEALKGDRAGQFSIRVNEKWRVCFRWQEENAHDVEIVDYH